MNQLIYRHIRLASVIGLVCIGLRATAQEQLQLNRDQCCSYYGEEILDNLYSFSSSNEAKEIIYSITDIVGLEPNFIVKAANVPNAVATIQGDQRLILYSQNFISSISTATGTDWAGISILAHEVGHHLNGHTITAEGSRPKIELEADKFSGFACAKMGASLKEAQIAMEKVAAGQGSLHILPKAHG